MLLSPQNEDDAGDSNARSIWARLRSSIRYVLNCLFTFFFSSAHLRGNSPAREVIAEKPEARLLVLGASDTGKSTFMRQMQLLCGHGYPPPERLRHQPHIRRNLLESLHKLALHLDTYGVQPATPEAQEAAQAFLTWGNLEGHLVEGAQIDKTLIPKAQTLWTDPGIQEVYRHRSDFHLMTNADYFISGAPRILQDEYLPTVEDILHMRYVTRGVVEHRHELENIIITMHDMGGQRPERENWCRQILDPSAILFLASLSEFDQNVEEANEEEVQEDKLIALRYAAIRTSRQIARVPTLDRTKTEAGKRPRTLRVGYLARFVLAPLCSDDLAATSTNHAHHDSLLFSRQIAGLCTPPVRRQATVLRSKYISLRDLSCGKTKEISTSGNSDDSRLPEAQRSTRD
ncbi:guanine nucleotide-binding protein G(q) subunit alpha-like [Penaeus japonicus]|uniref:guanine nucleotide-binding protein G(q) subunit alpha-like n=1 Tax=Penaeus japonicus TaxID=27405 RepID=UPI001C70FAA8|nr:guanine nucleotide-binding protein G(q) subunit alpha-like [Penaeus japonicus]